MMSNVEGRGSWGKLKWWRRSLPLLPLILEHIAGPGDLRAVAGERREAGAGRVNNGLIVRSGQRM